MIAAIESMLTTESPTNTDSSKKSKKKKSKKKKRDREEEEKQQEQNVDDIVYNKGLTKAQEKHKKFKAKQVSY